MRLRVNPVVWAALAASAVLGWTLTAVGRQPGSQSRQKRDVKTQAVQQERVRKLYGECESALRAGNLANAEPCFEKVLALDANTAGAYVNLGVISMRQEKWGQALTRLRKAEKLAPTVSGIRLNIGLVYYHENDFRSAIPAFESVVGDDPNSQQGRYLLGLCYFFTGRYADAARVLEPLWDREQNDINYLYVLGNAAERSDPARLPNREELENRALSRFIAIGQNTAEYHMLMGKAFLNRQEEAKAIPELEEAVRLDSNLPFVHFNLGLALLAQRDFEHARDEFQKDAAIEPDVAFNYDRLGLICFYLEDDSCAEKNFGEALRRDPYLASSYYGLARVYQRQGKFTEGLAAVSKAVKIAPEISNYHFTKGRILAKLGREQEAKTELAVSKRLLDATREKALDVLREGALPQPELSTLPRPQ